MSSNDSLNSINTDSTDTSDSDYFESVFLVKDLPEINYNSCFKPGFDKKLLPPRPKTPFIPVYARGFKNKK